MTSHDSAAVSPVDQAIRGELAHLARLYGIAQLELDDVSRHLRFDHYTEIALGRDGFEIIVGDLDAGAPLATVAASLQVPADTRRLFSAFSHEFPGRMGYLKLCFGRRAGRPTMHCGVVADWVEVFDFMERQSEFAGASAKLAAVADAHPLCHLVGFTTDHEQSPVIKVYWLLDQPAAGGRSPMLASARVRRGQLTTESKRYVMGARWDDASVDDRWRQIVTMARRQFTNAAWLSTSTREAGGAVLERKVYVFRHDARVPAQEMGRAFNLYYFEGLHHLSRGQVDCALQSFTNAVRFQPDHAHAFNNRGYCHIIRDQPWRAIPDCAAAVAIDPAISRRNLEQARAMAPPLLGSDQWLRFEQALRRGRIQLPDPLGRTPDLLDLPDGAAMLAALVEPLPPRVSARRLVLAPNQGDGDCLFHALAGSDLDDREVTVLRRQVAAVREALAEDCRGNLLRVVAALLQTPATRARGLDLFGERLTGLSNEVCAALQSVPGVFAGEPEIEQWCTLTGRRAGVVHEDGVVRLMSSGGSEQIDAGDGDLDSLVEGLLAASVVVLFRTDGHWQAVTGVARDDRTPGTTPAGESSWRPA